MKFFLLPFFFFGFSVSTSAQQAPGKITGMVMQNDQALAGATVTLLSAKDSSTIKFSASDKEGHFAFENVSPGKYLVAAVAVGYRKKISPVVEVSPAHPLVDVKSLGLAAVTKSMTGVTVSAARPFIEQKPDRLIVNVDASVTNIGSSALEVLEKAPGIIIDQDGNISLKGKDGVLVMIDGRPSQLSGADLANLLRNMNASQMDQVEIMTNPPARYDAAGNAGIINIKTKKNTLTGYNGSFTAGYMQGKYPKANAGFNFNYRQGKFNLFSNLSYSARKTFEKLTIQRNLLNANGTIGNYFDQQADRVAKGEAGNIKLGLDFFASKKTTFGIVLNGMQSASDMTNENQTTIFTAARSLERTTLASVVNDASWKNYGANLNYRTLLNKKGREITADIDYLRYDAATEQFMENSYYDAAATSPGEADTLLGLLPQQIDVYSARIDYVHPISKDTKFEAGLKSSLVNTDNDASYDSLRNGLLVHDYNRSNHFIYKERIQAAYANLNAPLTKKLAAQFGLRLEHTTADGNQVTTGQSFNRKYTSLFPTAYLQYKLNKKNTLGLNYGRRIRRPDYGSLNPFIRFIDRYTYNQGNPDLKPEYSNNIELKHSFKNFLVTTLNYTTTNDIIQSVIEQKGREAYQTTQNIASMQQLGLEINFNKKITKAWLNSSSVSVFNNTYKGVVNTADINFTNTSFVASSMQQVKLNKTLSAELNAMYRSGMLRGVLFTRPMGTVALGLSQQLFKNKGSVRLTVRDIFYTQKMRATVKYGNVDAAFQQRGDTRMIALGFSYRFSKGKTGLQRKRSDGSAGEEQNRIGIDQ